MRSVIIILTMTALVPALAAQAAPAPDAKPVAVHYYDFMDSTLLTANARFARNDSASGKTPPPHADPPILVLQTSFAGRVATGVPSSIGAAFGFYWAPPDPAPRELLLQVDGVPLGPLAADWFCTRAPERTNHNALTATLSPAQLRQLATAKKLDVQMGVEVYSATDSGLATIREFAAHLPVDSAATAASRATAKFSPFPMWEFEVERPALPLSLRASDVPQYPVMHEQSRTEGDVLAQYVVDTAGRVLASTFFVLRATDQYFAESVRKAVGRWRFQPAMACGRPVSQIVIQPFRFQAPNTH